MDPTPQPATPEPPAPVDAREAITPGRKISWLALMFLLVMPAVLAAGFAGVQFVPHWIMADLLHLEGLALFGALLAVAGTVAFVLGRAGLRRGWPRRGVLIAGWCLVGLGGLGLCAALWNVRRTSQTKVVQGNLRQLMAAADQYYLETGGIFATYDDLVGDTRYIKSITPVAGEDYRTLSPIRQDHNDELRVKLPDGRVINLYAPPDVPDGLHVTESGDLRFETTYRDKVPDGPARVVNKQGQVVSSANYVEGRIVGPCWYLGKDLNASANRRPELLGQEKLAAQDFKGAEADFTRALAAEPIYENYIGRADARLGQGLLDPAIADYLAAKNVLGGQLRNSDLPKLQQAYARQNADRKARDAAASVDAAAREVTRLKLADLFKQGFGLLQARNYVAAEAIFTQIIQLEPNVTGFARRSDARYELGDLDGTLADLNEAIRLSKPAPPYVFFKRAWFYRLKNDLPGAAADFRMVAGAQPNDVKYGSDACHAACWLYLVECERGQNQAAAEELARTVAQVDRLGSTKRIWYRLEADLLLGRITEEQLMAQVASPADKQGDPDRFQALFFAGMLHQRAGDTAGALDRFRRALETTYTQQFVPDVLEARRAVAAAGPAGK